MYAIYARVSTEEQAKKGYSLPDQLQTGYDYYAFLGIPKEQVEVFVDDGYSGEFLDRPALTRLRDKTYAKITQHVWVLDPDRLSRDDIHAFMLKEEIEKNATLYFHTGNYDKTPEGKLFFKIRASVATFEKDKIRERTTRGKRAKALQGKLTHNDKPLGYDYDENNSMYVVNSAEAETIKTIYHLYITKNMGTQQLADELNRLGIKTKQGKPFIRSTVLRIIKNEMYAGTKWAYRRYDKKIGHKQTKQTIRNQDEWIGISVPAIIDRETWERAQQIRSNNKYTAKRNAKYDYLVKNIIKCGACGMAMIGASWVSHGKEYYYYRCLSKHTKDKCAGKLVNAAELDNQVWEHLMDYAHNRIDIDALSPAQPKTAPSREKIEGQLAQLKKKQSAIIKWVKDGVIEIDAADKDLKDINQQIIMLQQQLAADQPQVSLNRQEILQASTYEHKRNIILNWGVKIKAWKTGKNVDFAIL